MLCDAVFQSSACKTSEMSVKKALTFVFFCVEVWHFDAPSGAEPDVILGSGALGADNASTI